MGRKLRGYTGEADRVGTLWSWGTEDPPAPQADIVAAHGSAIVRRPEDETVAADWHAVWRSRCPITKIRKDLVPGTMAAFLARAARLQPVGVQSSRIVDAKASERTISGGIPMMGRKWLVTLIALFSASSLACSKPGVTEKQKELQASDQAKAMTTEAQQHLANAQAEAEKTVSAARADFETARENYLHGRRLDLIDLDKKIADLETATPSSTARAADVRARLSVINAQRDAFGRHMAALETTPAVIWDAAAKKLDQEWDALKRAVDAAG